MALELFPEDVFLRLELGSREEVLHFLSEHLLERGRVTEGYEESLIERERDYPTGLSLGGTNLAIPHSDCQFARSTRLVVATFSAPILWRDMEDPDREIPVLGAVLSVFDKPDHQIEVLRQLMGVLQDQEAVRRLVTSDSVQEVMELFG